MFNAIVRCAADSARLTATTEAPHAILQQERTAFALVGG